MQSMEVVTVLTVCYLRAPTLAYMYMYPVQGVSSCDWTYRDPRLDYWMTTRVKK